MSDKQTAPAELDIEAIRDALRKVIDPEIGINIVDVGLIYRIAAEGDRVAVDLTMTSPACPMGDMIYEEVEAVLKTCLPPGLVPDLQLVWEPPWSPERMSETARQHFGWEE
jgi:metal-sulfur cluster biosynthetic enzyme